MKFEILGLAEPILRAVAAEGYHQPTPIQAKAIPHILAGRDLLGCAQTGTGKTAAFALPMLHRLASPAPSNARRAIRALILSPTRELASQIGESFRTYGRHTSLRSAVIFGGVGQNPQVRALREGIDILVATPGRLLDLMNQGYVDLRRVETFVLDEADRMLDMGFIHDIRRIVAKLPACGGRGRDDREYPGARQTLLFSATMPGDIRRLAAALLRDPVSVEVAPASCTADRIEQSVSFVPQKSKPAALAKFLSDSPAARTLVFTRTKHGADKVVKHLHREGLRADAIHGNKSQNVRERALKDFRTGRCNVLVATDIAARGLDVDDITHVINFDMPNVPETYVHRIGRTARAGASGVAISYCDHEERSHLRAIERLIRMTLNVIGPAPMEADRPAAARSDRARRSPARGQDPTRRSHRDVRDHQSSDTHSNGSGGRGSQGRQWNRSARRRTRV